MLKVENAIISVYDKSGVVDFARALADRFGVRIFSSGGTARVLREAGVEVTGISDYTGAPEMLDGRVKTLHPRVHAGLLARRDEPEHMRALEEAGVTRFDMVVVNLYPFEKVIASPEVDLLEALENIDIGGPSMLRSAAKNHTHVAVLVSPDQYGAVLEEMAAADGRLGEATLRRLAVEAFRRTASYDATIARWLEERLERRETFPQRLLLAAELSRTLRYGENPHQKAAFYRFAAAAPGALARAREVPGGKELSFNNLMDADGALSAVRLFEEPACAVVKHTVPCGLATAATPAEAFRKAHECDPVSAFGGIVALNRPLRVETARLIATADNFFEVVVAPDADEEAVAALREGARWGKNLRILLVDPLRHPDEPDMRYVTGGLLVQEADAAPPDFDSWRVVSRRQPTDEEMKQLRFGWLCVRYLKSNAIAVVRDSALVGSGCGQTSRVDAARVAVMRAGERSSGAVAASDAFFPFPDALEVLADAGVTAVVETGGSRGDEEVKRAADERGLALVFSGARHFRH